MIALGPEEIMALLPHRYPFLLVDRVLEVAPNSSAVGLKNVTLNEPFFQGHFPDYRVMPGVLVVEALAQLGGVLVYYSGDVSALEKVPLFTGIDRCRFPPSGGAGRSIAFARGHHAAPWSGVAISRQRPCGRSARCRSRVASRAHGPGGRRSGKKDRRDGQSY